MHAPIPDEVNVLSGIIVDAIYKVHKALGPGLLESAYSACLAHELRQRGHNVLTEHALPLVYDGVRVEAGYRVDLWIDGLIIVEVKSIEGIAPIHVAQIITYLKLSGTRVGLLVNFNELHIKDGIRRFAV